MARKKTDVTVYRAGSVEYMQEREFLRRVVRSMYDYQEMRMQSGNRLRTPKDECETQPVMSEEGVAKLEILQEDIGSTEQRMLRAISDSIKHFPEWEYWLKDVKGCGPLMAAVLITEVDITKCDNASKLTQYCGINPGTVVGKKRVDDGGGKHHYEATDELIRGDRMTKGFQRPYNARVRTKLLGVLATCMIKAGGEYYKVYRDAKTRYENSREPIGGRTDGLTWHDTSPSHRDKAAKRKMIRRFLEDGYPIWRELWGLPARCPYAEEYLGIRHNDPKWSGKEA